MCCQTETPEVVSWKCEHCGSAERHKGRCPRIKAVEFREGFNGTSIRYEYFPPAEFMIYAPDEPDTDYRKQYPFDLASAEARLKDGTSDA